MSIVKDNLLQDVNYRPYCGNRECKDMPRTRRTSEFQFKCPSCNWTSKLDVEFIAEYMKKHNLKRGD